MRKLLFIGALIMLVSCNESKQDFTGILGNNIEILSTDFNYGDYLSFSGEGYSAISYNIDEETLSEILNNIENNDLPKKEDNYSRQAWSKTPLNKSL